MTSASLAPVVPVGLGDSMGKDARRLVRRFLLERLDAALNDSVKRTEANLLADLDPEQARRQRAALTRRRNPLVGLISQLVAACDASGAAWMRQQTLAERLGRSERTVRRQVRELERLGILEVAAVCWTQQGAVEGSTGGRQGANRYQLLDVLTLTSTRSVEQVAEDCAATVSTPSQPSVPVGIPVDSAASHVRGGADMVSALYSQQINSKVVVAQRVAPGVNPGGVARSAADTWGGRGTSGASGVQVALGIAAAHRPADGSATDTRDQLRNGSAPTGMATATDGGDQLRDDLHSDLANSIRDAVVDAFPDMIDSVATDLALHMQLHPQGLAKTREIIHRAQAAGKGTGYIVTAMRAEIRKPSRLVNRAAERDSLEAEPSGLARYGTGASGADLDARIDAERERAERRFAELTGMVAA